MAATITQIAQKVGVSASLVSRVLRGDPTIRVSEGRRQAVLRAADQLGGVRRRNSAAVPLSALACNIVIPINEVFAPDWVRSHALGNPLFQSLRKYLKTRGFRLSSTSFNADDLLQEFRELIAARQFCDGVVLGSGILDPRLVQLFIEHKFPHVSVDLDAEKAGFNTVVAHTLGGLRQAVGHLVELGHRRIGYLGSTSATRYALWSMVMVEHGLGVEEKSLCRIPVESTEDSHDAWLADARAAMDDWLGRRHGETTAMVCSNDELALTLIERMQACGLRAGRDISVIGYDNIEQRHGRDGCTPVLTTIDNPTEVIGRRCGEVLLNQLLHGQHQIIHEQVPTRLILRQTTAPPLKGPR